MNSLEKLLAEGVEAQVFAQASAAVVHRGKLSLFGDGERLFDLASLTKVVSTAAIAQALMWRGQLALSDTVGTVLPRAAAAHVTIADLLFHRSGLPPFVPFFDAALKAHPELIENASHRELRNQTRAEVMQAVLATAPVAPNRTLTAYSDVGFLVLGHLLETLTGRRLDVLFASEIGAPLGLLTTGFRPISETHERPTVPTQQARPREPAIGQEGLWTVASAPDVRGGVDDDNAWVMNGVAGHAGLFGCAREVALFGQAVLEGKVRFPEPWKRDPLVPDSTRTLGFDTPSAVGASCGSRFGATPPGAIGHLGFTGTSLWVDLHRELVVVLLTNRTWLGRANVKIREFRPRFHEAVIDSLG